MSKKLASQLPIDIYLRVLIVSLILLWCFFIARPFLVIILWAVIIAVAFYPVYNKVLKFFKGKKRVTVAFFVLSVLLVLTIPAINLTRSVVKSAKKITHLVENKLVDIPPPEQKVKEWPLVGIEVFEYWSEAATNLELFIHEHNEQLTELGGFLLKGLGALFRDLGISLISLFVAGFFLYNSEESFQAANRFTNRLIGDKGSQYVLTARDTIRSVVQGILLVAIIQAVLAYASFAIMGIPAAAIWALLVLMLAIIQMPVIFVTLPMIVYGFSIANTTEGIIFTVAMIVVGVIDNLLKPLFLGRGVQVPMLIILIGSLGGMILHGIIGLFVGAVVLAIGYQTYMVWLESDPTSFSGKPTLPKEEQ